jgi:hypothetical protein
MIRKWLMAGDVPVKMSLLGITMVSHLAPRRACAASDFPAKTKTSPRSPARPHTHHTTAPPVDVEPTRPRPHHKTHNTHHDVLVVSYTLAGIRSHLDVIVTQQLVVSISIVSEVITTLHIMETNASIIRYG